MHPPYGSPIPKIKYPRQRKYSAELHDGPPQTEKIQRRAARWTNIQYDTRSMAVLQQCWKIYAGGPSNKKVRFLSLSVLPLVATTIKSSTGIKFNLKPDHPNLASPWPLKSASIGTSINILSFHWILSSRMPSPIRLCVCQPLMRSRQKANYTPPAPRPRKWFLTHLSRRLRMSCSDHLTSVVVRPHTHLNDFSYETPGPIFFKFHAKPSVKGRLKICSNGQGALIQMAVMPIYGKNTKFFSSRTRRALVLNLGIKHRGLGVFQVYSNNDRRLTFLRQGQICVPIHLYGENVEKSFSQMY